MNRAAVFACLAILLVADVAGVAAQSTDLPTVADPYYEIAERTANGIVPGTVPTRSELDRLVEMNGDSLEAFIENVTRHMTLFRDEFNTSIDGWVEVRLAGDTSTEPALWHRLDNASADGKGGAFVATSPGLGTLPRGLDRALEGPVFDLRYLPGAGRTGTNLTASSYNETYSFVDDFWGPTATSYNANRPGGLDLGTGGPTLSGTRTRFNPDNPLAPGSPSLSPSQGDVVLNVTHLYNFSHALTEEGLYFDGARLEVRLRGTNESWSRWVPLEPNLVTTLATATDKPYSLRALFERGPQAGVTPVTVDTEGEERVVEGNGAPTAPRVLDTGVPGTTEACLLLTGVDSLLRAANNGTHPGENLTNSSDGSATLAGNCPERESGPLNPGETARDGNSFAGNLFQAEYNGRVARFDGEYGYVGDTANATGNLTWILSSYDLSAFVGYEAQVRFRVASQPRDATRGEGWVLDGVNLTGRVWPSDLGVRNIVSPQFDEVLPSDVPPTVKATIRNYGGTRVDNAQAILEFIPANGTGTPPEPVTRSLGTLLPQEERVVTFTPRKALPEGGYFLNVRVDFPQAAVSGNPREALLGADKALVDLNESNNDLEFPVLIRSGILRALSPSSLTVTPAQADIGVEKYVNFTVVNEGNVYDSVMATLVAFRVDPATGKRINASSTVIPGGANEVRRRVDFEGASTFAEFKWKWTPTVRGVYDLVVVAQGISTNASASVRTYVRASAIPYFSESFNDFGNFTQIDGTRLSGPGGDWSVEQFPPQITPHGGSGAWVPSVVDTPLTTGGEGSKGLVNVSAGWFPISRLFAQGANPTVDGVWTILTGAYGTAIGTAVPGGQKVAGPNPPSAGLTGVTGGRMHYYLGREVSIPNYQDLEDKGEYVNLTFWHMSFMNQKPYDSPLSIKPEPTLAEARSNPGMAFDAAASPPSVGDVRGAVDEYRGVGGDANVLVDEVRAPLDEVYGRVLLYVGVTQDTGRGITVSPATGLDRRDELVVAPGEGLFVRYGDETAALRGSVATALGLANVGERNPYVLGYFNSSFSWTEQKIRIPTELISQGNGVFTILFEYATPPGRVSLVKLPTGGCSDDVFVDQPNCAEDGTGLGFSPLQELWVLDDFSIDRHQANGSLRQNLFRDQSESSSRPTPEWSAVGWKTRQWENPLPALWHVTTENGFRVGNENSTAVRSLHWGNAKKLSPFQYDDNVWSVLRTPPVNLSLATDPVLSFRHNFSFRAGKSDILFPPGGKALDGGNVRVRVLEDGVWSEPRLLESIDSPYTHVLYLDSSVPGEAHFKNADEEALVFSNYSYVNNDDIPDWTEARFDLAPYRGKTVMLEFQAFSRSTWETTGISPLDPNGANSAPCGSETGCSTDDGWFIDNVVVQERLLANDVRVVGLVSPASTLVGPGTAVPVSVLVENMGSFAQKHVRVNVNISRTDREDAAPYNLTVSMPTVNPLTGKETPLEPGQTAVLTLPAWEVPNEEDATYRVNITVSLFDPRAPLVDDNPTNDFLGRDLTAKAIHAIELRNLTLDPRLGDKEPRKVSVEVANVGNMVEDFGSRGLTVRFEAREAGAATWTPIGERTLPALRLGETWRPASPLLWTPTKETVYEVRAVTSFREFTGDNALTATTLTRVLSRLVQDGAEGGGLAAPSGGWGARSDSAFSGNASWAFPAVGDVYPDGVEGSLTIGPFNLFAAETAVLGFQHQYDFEDGYDGGRVEWSVDNETWTPLADPAGSRPLSTASPLSDDPSLPAAAYTGSLEEWTRVAYDLGLVPEFTRDTTIVSLKPSDINAIATQWVRNFTDFNQSVRGVNGSKMFHVTAQGLPIDGADVADYSVVLEIPLDLTPYTAASGVTTGEVRFADMRNLAPIDGGGVWSRFSVTLVDPVTNRTLQTFIRDTANPNDHYRDWTENRFVLDLATHGGKERLLRFTHTVKYANAAIHASPDFGWFVDNVQVIAKRGTDILPVYPAHGEPDGVEYATLAAARAAGWRTWSVRQSLDGNAPTGYSATWGVVDRVSATGWNNGQWNPTAPTLSVPKGGARNVESRIIFPVDLTPAADDVRLTLSGSLRFFLTLTKESRGGAIVEVSPVAPGDDPTKTDWIRAPLVPLAPGVADPTRVMDGYSPFGSDTERNSDYGSLGRALASDSTRDTVTDAFSFNLTEWRGQKVWVSLYAWTPDYVYADAHWNVREVRVDARVMNATNVLFRFHSATDANNNATGWRVDNITLSGYKRTESLVGRLEGLPSHGKVSGVFEPVLVLENRGVTPVQVDASVTAKPVQEGLESQTVAGRVSIPAESSVRLTSLGGVPFRFTADPGTSETGLAYRISYAAKIVGSSDKGVGGIQVIQAPISQAAIQEQKPNTFWNRTVDTVPASSLNAMWALRPAYSEGVHRNYLNVTYNASTASTSAGHTQVQVLFADCRILPPQDSEGVRTRLLVRTVRDTDDIQVIDPELQGYNPQITYRDCVSNSVNRIILPVSEYQPIGSFRIQFVLETDATEPIPKSLDLGWYLDSISISVQGGQAALAPRPVSEGLDGYGNTAAALRSTNARWTLANATVTLAEGEEVLTFGPSPVSWEITRKFTAKGWNVTQEGDGSTAIRLSPSTSAVDTRFTFPIDLVGKTNPILYLKHAYRFPVDEHGHAYGGGRIEVTNAVDVTKGGANPPIQSPNTAWRHQAPAGSGFPPCSRPGILAGTGPAIYGPLGSSLTSLSITPNGCMLSSTFASEAAPDEMAIDLSYFSSCRNQPTCTAYVSLHGWLPASPDPSASDAFWKVTGYRLQYEDGSAEPVEVRVLSSEHDTARVVDVTVTPNVINNTRSGPVTVVAEVFNDGVATHSLDASLVITNATTGAEVARYDIVTARVSPARDVVPGGTVTVSWPVVRSWPAGLYHVKVDARLGKRDTGTATYIELAPGRSFMQDFGWVANRTLGASSEGRQFWWNTGQTTPWTTQDELNPLAVMYPQDRYNLGRQHGLGFAQIEQGNFAATATRTLNLSGWDKAYMSFAHRYYFGEDLAFPASGDINDFSRGTSGGLVQACIPTVDMMGNPLPCTTWTTLQPVAHENGQVVEGDYPGYLVSKGRDPTIPTNPNGPPPPNRDYNFLAAEAPELRDDVNRVFVRGAYTGQSPGYGLDPSDPNGWVTDVLDMSAFAGKENVLIRFVAGLNGYKLPARWYVDAVTVSPHLGSIHRAQELTIADGVAKSFRFTLVNDGAFSNDFLVTANRSSIPSSWEFRLPDGEGRSFEENGVPSRRVTLNPGERMDLTLDLGVPIQRAFESDRRVPVRATTLDDPLKSTSADFSLHFEPRTWPDLLVDAVRVGVENPTVEGIVPVTVRVRNSGDEPAEGARVRLIDIYYPDPDDPNNGVPTEVPLLDAERDGSFTLAPFGATREVPFNWRPREAGQHTLLAVADPDGTLVEYALTNNVFSRPVTVSPPAESDLAVALDLFRESGERVTEEVMQGETVSVVMSITNNGNADAQGVLATLQVSAPGGVVFPLLPREPFFLDGSIAPGETRTVRALWFAETADPYAILASAFAQGGVIPERKGVGSDNVSYTADNYRSQAVLVRATGLRLAMDSLDVSVAPGGRVEVPFNLTNAANGEDNVLLDAEVPEGFRAAARSGGAEIAEAVLAVGERLGGVLVVNAPVDALSETVSVRLLARSDRSGEVVDRTLRVTVLPRHQLSVEAADVTAEPGAIQVPVEIVNRGNILERLTVDVVRDVALGESVTVLTEAIEVPAFSPYTGEVAVSIPHSTLAGTYPLRLRFINEDGSATATVAITLRVRENATLDLAPRDVGATVATGDTLKTLVAVSNVGNVPVSAAVTVAGLPEGMTLELPDPSLTLDLGEAADVPLTLKVSPGATPGIYPVVLAVSAPDGTVLGAAEWPVEVAGADYALVDLVHTPKADLVAGMDVRVTGLVSYHGALRSAPVPVAFYVDGHLVNYTLVGPLAPGEKASVDFAWKALDGTHVLWVTVDPHETLGESNRDNNARLLEVTGAPEAGGVLGGLTVPLAGSPLVVAGLLVAVALASRRTSTSLKERRR